MKTKSRPGIHLLAGAVALAFSLAAGAEPTSANEAPAPAAAQASHLHAPGMPGGPQCPMMQGGKSCACAGHEAGRGTMDHGTMDHRMMDHGTMDHGTMDHGMMMDPGMMDHGAAPLRQLNLTEAQRDEVFRIFHAQAPALRDQAKALRKAEEALHALVESADYSEAKAKPLAEAAGKAMADMSLARARTERQVFDLLTPDQRRELSALKARGESSDHGPACPMQPHGRN